ncbi:MAG: hypothetical protein NZL85_06125 [Fimbriimonadales bacterium]|nr:hypothetical protein [Fimbriimonadales bacterium]
MEEQVGCRASVERVLEQLEREAPRVPLLALGQTVFWDEPTKSLLLLLMEACGRVRPFFLGVHDTDYFARLHAREWRIASSEWRGEGFALLPHNDYSTRALWSSAGEISCLFGSELIPTRARYREAGAQLEKVAQRYPEGRTAFLDAITEAWGWRGLVATERTPRPVCEIPVQEILPALDALLQWGFEQTLQCLADPVQRERARQRVEMIRQRVHELAALSDGADALSLADLYRYLHRDFLVWLIGRVPEMVGFTRTTELLRFTPETAHLPRFQLLQHFLDPRTRPVCERAYNEAVAGTEIYTLDEFGEGALPFDLLIPGRGRGTLLLTERYLTILTPDPLVRRLKQPIETVDALAELITREFGDACTLIGKALTLVPMLAHEFLFVFNERGSPYLSQSARMLQRMRQEGVETRLYPLLRIRHATWDSIGAECVQLRLPEHLAAVFGERELCSDQFARRWREVVQEQQQLLRELGACRSPRELMRYLAARQGEAWRERAEEYEQLHARLQQVREQADALRQQAHALHAERRALKAERARLEREKGEHFRKANSEWRMANGEEQAGSTHPQQAYHQAQREACEARLQAISERLRAIRQQLRQLLAQRLRIGRTPDLLAVRERVQQLEYEAERTRIELARNAILTAEGLALTNARPTAWWFLLVSEAWFRASAQRTEIYLESLSAVRSR